MSESVYQSEDGCDQWIAENLKLPEKGFFVDAGCAHPVRYSQTHWLRWLGWRGLAIDGDPSYAPEWCGIHETTFVNAVLAPEGSVPFLIEPTNSLVSRVHQEGKLVRARTLNSILDEYGVRRVDFLAIDIEGLETQVLRDFLIGRGEFSIPEIIVAEYNSTHKGRDVSIFNELARTTYRLAHMTESNAVFTR